MSAAKCLTCQRKLRVGEPVAAVSTEAGSFQGYVCGGCSSYYSPAIPSRSFIGAGGVERPMR